MRAWCDQCEKYIDCSDEYSRMESLEIKGVRFNALQSFGKCPICGGEVLTNAMADTNISRAHDAYRIAIGSITAQQIRDILETYDIGAQPLSRLLGWGDNTIERQMKHTIPDRERARRLRELNDPRKMLELLDENGGAISDVAQRKARKAALKNLFLFQDNSHDGKEENAILANPAIQAHMSKPRIPPFHLSIEGFIKTASAGFMPSIGDFEQEKQKQYHFAFAGGK